MLITTAGAFSTRRLRTDERLLRAAHVPARSDVGRQQHRRSVDDRDFDEQGVDGRERERRRFERGRRRRIVEHGADAPVRSSVGHRRRRLRRCLRLCHRSAANANAGTTKGGAVATLAHALALASPTNARVYACGEMFNEAIEVPSGVHLSGGLACSSDWHYDVSARSQIGWNRKAASR